MKNNAFKPKFTITNPILNSLMAIERARGFLDAANVSKRWLQKTSRMAWQAEAHHTTHIEGSQLTLEQSKRILSGKKVRHTNPHDVKEVLNYKDALDLTLTEQHKNITEGLIKKIHKQLVKGVRGGKAKPGRYRNIQNYIGNAVTKQIIYMPPKPQQVPALMQEFVKWINTQHQLHPVLKSGIVQFQLVQIHPFVDGNGRVSRLLCSLYLHKSNYNFKNLFSLSQYYDEDRQNFYAALQSVREQNMDMTPWLEYFTIGLEVQITHALADLIKPPS